MRHRDMEPGNDEELDELRKNMVVLEKLVLKVERGLDQMRDVLRDYLN